MPLCRPFIFLLMLAGIGACGDAPPAPLSRPEKLAADLCKCTENLLALNAQAQSSADSLAFRNIAAAFENSARCIQNLGIKPEDKTLLAPALAQNCSALAKEQELLTELLGFEW
jgi:hypothetical protein